MLPGMQAMSDSGKGQEPSMEEILASIRRIIAEDEAGRGRPAAAPRAATSTDGPSRGARPSWNAPAAPSPRTAPTPERPRAESGEFVLDLTNMVAADGSVVTIAPNMPPSTQRNAMLPPPLPMIGAQPGQRGDNAGDRAPIPFSGSPRRSPPPGPVAEQRLGGFDPPRPAASAPSSNGYESTDTPSRNARFGGPPPAGVPASAPLPGEDSPSRRVFKRRHAPGSTFNDVGSGSFAPPPASEADSPFGKVPTGAIATELELSPAPMAPPPVKQNSFARTPAAYQPHAERFDADPFAPAPLAAATPPPLPVQAPPPPQMGEDQIRAIAAAALEPAIRAWIDNNLARVVDDHVNRIVHERVAEALTAAIPQSVDDRIKQNVEGNLGPYIEDRVGAHLDARLAQTVEDKVAAGLAQRVPAAVTEHVPAAVGQQMQNLQQHLVRAIDDRVKAELRSMLQRMAGA